MKNIKSNKRQRRHHRIRSKVHGTKLRPRLAIFKSNRHVYVQLIDDESGKTLSATSDLLLNKGKKVVNNINLAEAEKIGEDIASKAGKLNIKEIVFDRGGFKYHGLIKAVAEGARKGGLKF